MLQTVFPHVLGAPGHAEQVLRHLPTPVRSAFRRMEVAEQEIARAKRARPERSKALHRAFGVLCPSPILEGTSDDVYRVHCRELLERVAQGEGTEPGTDAECLAAMLQASLRAPLRREGLAVAHHLARRVLPKLGGDVVPEIWAGQVAEDLRALRKRIAVEGRRLDAEGAL